MASSSNIVRGRAKPEFDLCPGTGTTDDGGGTSLLQTAGPATCYRPDVVINVGRPFVDNETFVVAPESSICWRTHAAHAIIRGPIYAIELVPADGALAY